MKRRARTHTYLHSDTYTYMCGIKKGNMEEEAGQGRMEEGGGRSILERFLGSFCLFTQLHDHQHDDDNDDDNENNNSDDARATFITAHCKPHNRDTITLPPFTSFC